MVDYFVKEPQVKEKLLLEKGGKDKSVIKNQFEIILDELKEVGWEAINLENLFRKIAQEQNYHIGKFFMAVRIALTGKSGTPPLFETMELLGKEKTLKRLKVISEKFK
jgi:glutamyl-tRNA synthetase